MHRICAKVISGIWLLRKHPYSGYKTDIVFVIQNIKNVFFYSEIKNIKDIIVKFKILNIKYFKY